METRERIETTWTTALLKSVGILNLVTSCQKDFNEKSLVWKPHKKFPATTTTITATTTTKSNTITTATTSNDKNVNKVQRNNN